MDEFQPESLEKQALTSGLIMLLFEKPMRRGWDSNRHHSGDITRKTPFFYSSQIRGLFKLYDVGQVSHV